MSSGRLLTGGDARRSSNTSAGTPYAAAGGGGLPLNPSSSNVNGDTANPPVGRPRRSSHSSRQRRSRRKLYSATILIGVFIVMTVSTATRWMQSTARSRAQAKARSSRILNGFTESRLTLVPADLRKDDSSAPLSVEQLLSHPLLSRHRKPSCQLLPVHNSRYEPLKEAYGSGRHRKQGRRPLDPHDQPRHGLNYLIALNLYSSETVVPTLFHALYETLDALGPHRFHISIYENGSADDTPAQLYLLSRLLDYLGAGYTIVSDAKSAGFAQGSRIASLAAVRNLALAPLLSSPPGTFDRVLFLNDVHLCKTDLMEILLQHEVQQADMSCGMDYKELKIKEFEPNYPLLFYDVWVARDMLGLPFYNIQYPGGGWALPSLPLPHSPARFRFHSLLPFQVYSCFNGITVLQASLFLPPYNLRFRAEDSGGDAQSECFLLCSDIWKALAPWDYSGVKNPNGGRGARIQVVPRVSVGYEVHEYEKGRQDRNVTGIEYFDASENYESSGDGQSKKKIGFTFPRADRAAAVEVYRKREIIQFEPWPPKLVVSYPFARWADQASIPPF